MSHTQTQQGRHDPWSNEFIELFNDPAYEPQVPEISGGAVQELLDKFEPWEAKNTREGARLKERWQKIRSSFTVAYSNWSRSGHNDQETFPSYTQDDDSLIYVFCIFNDQPSLDYALRLLPEGARAESGVPSEFPQLDRSAVRKRRRESRSGSLPSSAGDSIAECMSAMADALKQPVVLSAIRLMITSSMMLTRVSTRHSCPSFIYFLYAR
jgi:hypothetical protein